MHIPPKAGRETINHWSLTHGSRRRLLTTGLSPMGAWRGLLTTGLSPMGAGGERTLLTTGLSPMGAGGTLLTTGLSPMGAGECINHCSPPIGAGRVYYPQFSPGRLPWWYITHCSHLGGYPGGYTPLYTLRGYPGGYTPLHPERLPWWVITVIHPERLPWWV